jgi:hypothetical protein
MTTAFISEFVGLCIAFEQSVLFFFICFYFILFYYLYTQVEMVSEYYFDFEKERASFIASVDTVCYPDSLECFTINYLFISLQIILNILHFKTKN